MLNIFRQVFSCLISFYAYVSCLFFLNEGTITDLSQSSAWRKRWHSVRVVDIRVDRGGASHPGCYAQVLWAEMEKFTFPVFENRECIMRIVISTVLGVGE